MGYLRQKSILLAATVAFVAVMAGCGGGNAGNGSELKGQQEQSSGSVAPAKESVTITMEVGQALKEVAPHAFSQANIDEFEKQTNVKVKVIIDPDNQVKNVLQTKLSTSETPDIVVFNKVSGENELNTANYMLDLSGEPWVRRLTNPDALKAPDGNIYGFVMQSPLDAQAIVYNKAIFQELGLSVPTSYDEFLAVCEKIKQAGIAPIFAPFKDRWTFQIWTAGPFGYVATKEKPSLWADINAGTTKFSEVPEFEEILTKGLQLVERGYISPSALSDDYNMAPDAFMKKKAAMMIMGDWFVSDMKVKDPSIELGLFPVPAFNGKDLMISQSQITGMLHIPKAAKYPEEAKMFLDFLSQKEQMDRAQSDQPFMPSVNDASAPSLTPLQQEIYDTYIKTNKAVVEMNAFMKVDLTELWKYYQDMIAGGKTPKQVLEAWDEKFAELMSAANQPGF
ncbi:ABC transporter substrate-binding protein [Cohnella lupini]|uniref:Carbohydrate ABC transporter substrate-binding protein (CUT1 family) n=1 Tax=Cohnella lupini TaxID=1294267 RepID=A0A3D9I0M8_9BACL|nr:extracellular solute-binding protein [Cohnella lupini]RED55294.1 carbohydrate ABC transporter substrate-binding protein (CUT1 family) [Cohnella lupini]